MFAKSKLDYEELTASSTKALNYRVRNQRWARLMHVFSAFKG